MENKPTPQVIELKNALERRGLKVETEYFDGYKSVDIYLPEADMYIEVDGLQHLTDPNQIISDLQRDYYSNIEELYTLRIHNIDLVHHLVKISEAIADVVIERRKVLNSSR